jgi:XRE family transcriptional regulator, fatty acid utilization regulator
MIEPLGPYMKLGIVMRSLRKRAGLTQVEAAERIGIRSTFVSQIENGARGMRWHTMLALLDAYNADLTDLAARYKTSE